MFRGAPPTQSYLRVSVGVAQGRSPGAALGLLGLLAALCAVLVRVFCACGKAMAGIPSRPAGALLTVILQ